LQSVLEGLLGLVEQLSPGVAIAYEYLLCYLTPLFNIGSVTYEFRPAVRLREVMARSKIEQNEMDPPRPERVVVLVLWYGCFHGALRARFLIMQKCAVASVRHL
jgi:hypothetical protein